MNTDSSVVIRFTCSLWTLDQNFSHDLLGPTAPPRFIGIC